ncbi:MAG: hypothetical protein ACRDOV_09090, partial [Streptomyces sp.]
MEFAMAELPCCAGYAQNADLIASLEEAAQSPGQPAPGAQQEGHISQRPNPTPDRESEYEKSTRNRKAAQVQK